MARVGQHPHLHAPPSIRFQRKSLEHFHVSYDEWLQIEVISAEIPLSFYNISSALQNNTFNYTKIPSGTVSLIIPSGNYTVDSLMSTINGLQNDFTMSYSDVFNKFLITCVNI